LQQDQAYLLFIIRALFLSR